jgi:hypothetical protein
VTSGTTRLLVLLCAVRVAIPLAALAAAGSALPGLPRYEWVATPGDAHGFYSAAREFMAAWGRLGFLLPVAVLALVAGAVAAALFWRRGGPAQAWAVVAAAAGTSAAVTLAVTEMSGDTGAATVGWSLVWGAVMLPVRAVGVGLGPEEGFGFGLALSLAANVATVVATWVVAIRVTGRRAVAGLAAALIALWPFLSGLVAGSTGWENGTWEVDAGLHLYTEPLSTALVTAAVALAVAERPSGVTLALAGVLLGLATTTRLSNGLLAVALVLLLARRLGFRRLAPLAAAGAAFAPVVAVWWPKGYAALFDRPDVWPTPAFDAGYVVPNWTESLFFSPRSALVLAPLVFGAVALRRRLGTQLLVAVILVNAIFYSFYANTGQHPRFFHVTIPLALVLWAAGAQALAARAGIERRLQAGRARVTHALGR